MPGTWLARMEASSAMLVRQGVSEELPLEWRAKSGEAASHAEIWVKTLQIEGMPWESGKHWGTGERPGWMRGNIAEDAARDRNNLEVTGRRRDCGVVEMGSLWRVLSKAVCLISKFWPLFPPIALAAGWGWITEGTSMKEVDAISWWGVMTTWTIVVAVQVVRSGQILEIF